MARPLKTKPNPLELHQPDRRGEAATFAQLHKLLVALATDGFIGAEYDQHSGDWSYAIDEAIAWVQNEMGYRIDVLEELTQGQVALCLRMLEGK